jgi:hypothetical protein
MSSGKDSLERLQRAVRRQRAAIVALGGAAVLLVAGGQVRQGAQTARPPEAETYPRYAAGGDKLYRIDADGSIAYLVVDLAQGTGDGIPGWAQLHVDDSLSRDRMGNITRVGR